MRSSCMLLAAVVLFAAVLVRGQAPDPPPIWPVSFQARFGLDMIVPPPGTNIVNSTSMFYYNLNDGVLGQLIDYPEFCPPSSVGKINSACKVLFNEAPGGGIYITQPAEGVDCCQMFQGVGPTPRNFTRGFVWTGTEIAQNYFGDSIQSDYYVGGDAPNQFYYWTQIITHHDVKFHDGGGADWAWDHLNVTTVDPSVFDLFSDPATCAKSCFGEEDMESAARVAQHAPIALALHHFNQARVERGEKPIALPVPKVEQKIAVE